jgi:hypothetical protein
MEELEKTTGIRFGIPDNVKNITLRAIPSRNMAEMNFMINDIKNTLRAQPSKDFKDISGVYAEWENEESGMYKEYKKTLFSGKLDNNYASLFLWYDETSETMYSLYSVSKNNFTDSVEWIDLIDKLFVPVDGNF